MELIVDYGKEEDSEEEVEKQEENVEECRK